MRREPIEFAAEKAGCCCIVVAGLAVLLLFAALAGGLIAFAEWVAGPMPGSGVFCGVIIDSV